MDDKGIELPRQALSVAYEKKAGHPGFICTLYKDARCPTNGRQEKVSFARFEDIGKSVHVCKEPSINGFLSMSCGGNGEGGKVIEDPEVLT